MTAFNSASISTDKDTKFISETYYSARAFLAGVGAKVKVLDIFAPIAQGVTIAQKKVKDTPIEKLYDAFISILCGAQGIVEVNKLVRSDLGIQQAFGRNRCAEQSVIQETLNASSANNVEQMETAMNEIYRQHSQGYQHDYEQQIQVLDIDMTGQPCGPKAAFATKGYFAGKRNRRGRQVGRVLASHYDEIVVERVFAGKVQLTRALQPLVKEAEKTLAVEQSPPKRCRILLRVDAGGGSQDDVNWMLQRNYLILTKDYSTQRARKLAETVNQWVDDPNHPGRQIGLVTASAHEYCQSVVRIAVRCRKNNGQWGIGVLITNLKPNEVAAQLGIEPEVLNDPHQLLLAYAWCYDQRGGAVETSFKQDNQALGMKKRNKKRFESQQMLTQLNALAHNVLVWAQRWLRMEQKSLKKIGFVRLMRDVLTTSGQLCFDKVGNLIEIRLNAADTLVKPWIHSLSALLNSEQVAVNLVKT
jgi:hypothetical protein